MKKFIDEIIDLYNSNRYPNALSTCIITPNKRAHRFIQRKLISTSTKEGFLPKLFSIDDFIFHHIPLVRIDEVDLTYILYEVFNSLQKESLDFDEFLGYSSILLHDFNEIDMQMADGKDIFSYLNDAKAIQQWNPDGSPLSDAQKEYLKFYNHLSIVYTQFREALLEKGLCYQGMAYRYLAENLENLIDKISWDEMIFAGFNALTKSEEVIIKSLAKKEIVKTIWDVDSYYYNDPIMEAGMYFRKYKSWDKNIEQQAQQHFQSPNKSIEITGVPGVLGQVRYAAQILDENSKQKESTTLFDEIEEQASDYENNTVIVPADEKTLVALLNSLPTRILKNTNITMGFSIQHTHAYRLAESLIRLHLHSSKISSLNSGRIRFHKDDLLAVLNNKLIEFINPNLIVKPNDITQNFVGQELVLTLIDTYQLNSIAEAFISAEEQPSHLIQKLRMLFTHLIELKGDDEKSPINPEERDALEQIMLVFNRLKALIEEHQQPQSLQGIYSLYKQLIQGLSQAFTGDFEKGLQLMGLLETRLMDFENVIIISTNEDILPASAFSSSFIPSDIRFEFELPGIQERTAVFAYHFYRLIQRAKNVDLIYSTTKKKMSGGEKSRFIKQIEFELKKYNPHLSVNHQLLNFNDLVISKNKDIIIQKDDLVKEKLIALAKKGISPTALISYTRCPLHFYFKYIAKVYEPDPAEDIVDERIIGNVIHKILEDFYLPYVKKDFPYEKLKTFKKQIPKLIAETFKKEFKGKLDEGPNYLSLKDTEYYLNKFVDYEIQDSKSSPSKLIILGVEENLKREIEIGEGDKKIKVLLKGNADRIDEKDNLIRILDYKTGTVDKKKLALPKTKEGEINPIFTDSKYDKALQLFVYHWLYRENSSAEAQAGIVSFRHIKSPYLMLKGDIGEDLDTDFQDFLSSIFNPDYPFTQTTDLTICSYCTYKNICTKKGS